MKKMLLCFLGIHYILLVIFGDTNKSNKSVDLSDLLVQEILLSPNISE